MEWDLSLTVKTNKRDAHDIMDALLLRLNRSGVRWKRAMVAQR